jgi:uncharacterized damage-inducible protein DinB
MESLNRMVWQQFGAAIDMLENAIKACPDALWENGSKFWYLGFHTLFWTDYYLSDSTPMEKDFTPPAPFTKSDFEYDRMPERVYEKAELLAYCKLVRGKLHDQLSRLTPYELVTKRFVSENRNFPLLELLLYNMRHVQHHTAQLNLLLRQGTNEAPPDWVSRTKAPW